MTTAIFFLRGMPNNFTAPVVVSGNAPDGNVGDAYSYTFTASGGDGGPYTWSVFSGSLPTGTSLNASTGEVSGTLTAASTFNFVIRATDSLAATGDSSAQSVVVSAVTWSYVRINVTAPQAGSYVSISEIEVRATLGGADQCTGGTPSASSVFTGTYAASMAFDNNTGTEWASNVGMPQWIQYQFAAPVIVAQVAIQATDAAYGGPNERPKDFTIQGSNDGSSWTTLASPAAQTGWTNSEIRTFNI